MLGVAWKVGKCYAGSYNQHPSIDPELLWDSTKLSWASCFIHSVLSLLDYKLNYKWRCNLHFSTFDIKFLSQCNEFLCTNFKRRVKLKMKTKLRRWRRRVRPMEPQPPRKRKSTSKWNQRKKDEIAEIKKLNRSHHVCRAFFASAAVLEKVEEDSSSLMTESKTEESSKVQIQTFHNCVLCMQNLIKFCD
jgi:hypothetical protein